MSFFAEATAGAAGVAGVAAQHRGNTNKKRQTQKGYNMYTSHDDTLSPLDRPMPMHRHFMLQRKLEKEQTLQQRPPPSPLPNNNVSVNYKMYNKQTNHENKEYNSHKQRNLKSDETKTTNIDSDPLSSAWWFRLDDGPNIPDTRRSHHSVLYSFEVVNDDDDNDETSDAATSSMEGEVGNDIENGENDDMEKHDISPKGTETKSSSSSSSSSSTASADVHDSLPTLIPSTLELDTTTTTTIPESGKEDPVLSTNTTTNSTVQQHTPPTIPTNHTPTRKLPQLDPSKSTKTKQEYMIVSGGFTDFDWHSFPVWAYDIHAAMTGNEGKWYEILKVKPGTASKSTKADHTKFVFSDDQDVGGTWRSYGSEQGNAMDDDNYSEEEQMNQICNHADDSSILYDKENMDDLWNQTSLLCAPPSRVGHISVMRGEYLYVFGGSLYNDKDGVFFMEEKPYMYRLLIPSDYFAHPKKYDESNALTWERIVPNIAPPPPYVTGGSMGNEFGRPEDIINRGEVRGGYWEEEDKLVIYGGLHVRDYESAYGREQQADETLGDVWCYDFTTDTWEMMAPAWAITDDLYKSAYDGHFGDHPGKRTSHGATVVGDELVIYGGLRKVETYFFDGSTVWDQLDDVWVFNLRTLEWKQRMMKNAMGRAYHSIVGWKNEGKEGGTVLATFGGYRMQTDPVDNEEIEYVYDDTMISFPQKVTSDNMTTPSIWFLAMYEGSQRTTISTRLEQSTVLSKEFGTMIVWGGRYRDTINTEGIWSLNINGKDNNVIYTVRGDDDVPQDIGVAYIVLVTVMLMSMMFTYMCGILHRQIENQEGGENITMEQVMDPNNGFSFARRNGLSPEIIDTLPVQLYEPGMKKSEPSSREEGQLQDEKKTEVDGDGHHTEVDEHCCAICLVDYEEGDEIRVLPCGHEFHKSCVDSWLGNNPSCPACRYSLQDLSNLSTATNANENTQGSGRVGSTRRRLMSSILLSTLRSRIRLGQNRQQERREPSQAAVTNEIVSTVSNESLGSLQNIRSRSSSNDADSIDDLNLELSYTSSLEEYNENLPGPEGSNSMSNRRFRPIGNEEDIELPVHGRSRRMRVSASERRRTRRLAGRRSRGARSPLNDPLQPANGSIV